MLELDGLTTGFFVVFISQTSLDCCSFLANYDLFNVIVDLLLRLKIVKALSLIAVSIDKLVQNVSIVQITGLHDSLGEVLVSVHYHA